MNRCHVLGLCLLAFSSVESADARPRTPSDPGEVLERATPADASDMPQLRSAASQWRNHPDDYPAGLALAERYISLGRAQNDPRFYGRAEGVLAVLADIQPAEPRALVLTAVALQARHAFDAARSALERALNRDPRNAQAWLTRSTIERVQGNYPAALAACARLSGLVEPLVTATCLAAVKRLDGEAAVAEQLLGQTLARAPSREPAIQQWALTTQAEIARSLGHLEAATSRYEAALELHARSVYLLLSYADHLLDLGKPAKVLSLLEDEVRLDGALLRLTLAAKAVGDPRYPVYRDEFGARLAAARGSNLHQGEAARFQLDVAGLPAEALTLAVDNWSRQREPIDARIVLDAALRSGRPEAARAVRDFLESHATEDPVLARLVTALARHG